MPGRGEVWLVDLGMVEKVRRALILSGHCGPNDRDIITVIPHTTTLRGSRFEIKITLQFLKPGAFLVQSPASVPRVRALKLLGRMSQSQLESIENGLLEWLEISRALRAQK